MSWKALNLVTEDNQKSSFSTLSDAKISNLMRKLLKNSLQENF